MSTESAVEITRVAHGLTIGDNKFGNARPAVVEAILKPGRTLEEALDELDDRISAWHKRKYPQLYAQAHPGEDKTGGGSQALPDIMTEKTPERDMIAQMIADIYSCTELKVLEGYRLLAKTKPEFQAAYDQMTQKLTNELG